MITVEQAKLHLRVDGDDDDLAIQFMIDASTAAAANYLNMTVEDMLVDTPAPIEAAILLQVGDLYANREAQGHSEYFSNKTYHLLLNPYRVMAV